MQALIPICDFKSSHKREQFIVQSVCKVKICTGSSYECEGKYKIEITERQTYSSALTVYREVFI